MRSAAAATLRWKPRPNAAKTLRYSAAAARTVRSG